MNSEEDQTQLIDWAYLPQGATEHPLDIFLHDAFVEEITSFRDSAIIEFVIDIPHLKRFFPNTKFRFKFIGVKSARAEMYVPPPDGSALDMPMGEEKGLALKEYFRKTRWESISWQQLESSLPSGCLEIHGAQYAEGPSGCAICFSVDLRLPRFEFRDGSLTVSFDEIEITNPGRAIVSLDELERCGTEFWKQF